MNSDMNRENLLYTLPSVLSKDKGMRPLGETVATALERLWGRIDLPTLYTHIDDLSEEMLDILAQDFKVDWYDYNQTLEVKRAVIKDSFYVHRHLGTVGAVKRALSDVWSSYLLEEWFQYDGEPYHFRVAIADNDFTVTKREQAIRLINMTKNVRSWLDDIYAQTITNIVVQVTTGYAYVDYLVASEIEYTNANDIDDWEEPQFETQDAQVDVTRVGASRVAASGNTIVIPDSMTVIPVAGYMNESAETIVCPSGCTAILDFAFIGCSNLRTIVIPAATTQIADNAFGNIVSESITEIIPAWTDGGYIGISGDEAGKVVEYDRWKYSDFIYIGDADFIYSITTAPDNRQYNAFYSDMSEDSFISSFTAGQSLLIPAGAKYLRFSCRTSEKVEAGKREYILDQDINLTIKTPAGSYAETYAENHGYNVIH